MKAKFVIDGIHFELTDNNITRYYVVGTSDNKFIKKLIEVVTLANNKYSTLHKESKLFTMMENTLDSLNFYWDVIDN